MKNIRKFTGLAEVLVNSRIKEFILIMIFESNSRIEAPNRKFKILGIHSKYDSPKVQWLNYQNNFILRRNKTTIFFVMNGLFDPKWSQETIVSIINYDRL